MSLQEARYARVGRSNSDMWWNAIYDEQGKSDCWGFLGRVCKNKQFVGYGTSEYFDRFKSRRQAIEVLYKVFKRVRRIKSPDIRFDLFEVSL